MCFYGYLCLESETRLKHFVLFLFQTAFVIFCKDHGAYVKVVKPGKCILMLLKLLNYECATVQIYSSSALQNYCLLWTVVLLNAITQGDLFAGNAVKHDKV